MKPVDHALDRLFRAAAKAPIGDLPVISPALEARILAARQHPSRATEEFMALLSLFRRGFAVAALVAAVTGVICLRGDNSPDGQLPAMDLMVLDSVAEMSLLP